MKIKKLLYVLMPLAMLAFGSCQEEPVKAPAVNLNKETLEIGAGNETGSVLFQPTRDWSATVEDGADWLAVDPVSGPASPDAVVEVKVTVLANEGAERSAEIIFTAGNVDETLTVVQAANGSQGGGEDEDVITVADFLSKSVDTGVYYKLKGEITDLYNTEFGNFHLVDETGSVRVYGLTATKQPYGENDKSFSTLGLEEGDIVVIEGVRDEYNGEAQVGGAYYISHEEGQGGGDEPLPDEFTSIADIRAMAPASQSDTTIIGEGVAVKVFVVSSLEANTLTSKKNVYVQDATGGIQVRFQNDATWNFGDEIAIDLSGQKIIYYGGAIQIDALPNSNVQTVSTGNSVEAKQVSVADFMEGKYESQYVALPDVQVVEADLNKTIVMNDSHTSINVEDITGHSFVIFSSKYTVFGDEKVPQGAGTLKGVSMVYNGTMQIGLTSRNDYAGMTGTRFESQGGGDDPTPDDLIEATIGEFIDAEVDPDVWYKLTGTITEIQNDLFGNIVIEDESGSVLIYGLTATKQSSNDKSFSTLGLEKGDIVTLGTVRNEYKGTPQGGGNTSPAYYISHQDGPGGGDDPQPGNNIGEVEVTLGNKAYIQDAVVNGEDFKVLKLGTSSENGDASFTIPAGTAKITFYCVAWKDKKSTLNLSGDCTITPSSISPASNSGATGNPEPAYIISVTDSDRYEFAISGCNSDTVIKLASEDDRVILWDIQLD